MLNTVVSAYGRHCSPSPFAAIWGRAVCTTTTVAFWGIAIQFSVGVWVILINVLFCWSSELNTINHTGTGTPFLAHALGGEATDLPCHRVTSLQCQISVACTCLESSWLLQSPLLKERGRVAPSWFLSGAVIPCHLLADSNRAFERPQGTGIAACTVRLPNHEVSLVTSRGQGSHGGYLFCCVGRWVSVVFFPAFLGIVPVQLMLSLSPWPACMS